MTTKTHEIKLDGYGAHTTLAEDRPIMLLGTAESYGIEMLHIVSGKDWAELTITATFNASDGSSTDILMDTDGNVVVPSEATAKSGSGKIVFTGVSEGVQRISCDLEYFVVAHSAINGVQSGGTAPSWFEQAVTRFMPTGGTAGQVLTKKTDTDFEAEWQDSKGGANGITPTIGDNGNWFLGDIDTEKPSRGTDGKSAYSYAVDGGYTGTEEEFVEKMASPIPAVDDTLTQPGQPADAKAVGDILATLTLGQHTDGLIYIFLGGKPMGNGLSINGEIVEPVYGDPVVDNAILSITKGQTVQLGVKLSEKPTQDQTVTVLTESNALTFDKATLNFTPDNWSEFQFVSVTAGDVDADATATITLRNSDELLTDTNIMVYLTADGYAVDTTIPTDGQHIVTLDDFESTSNYGNYIRLYGYKGEYDNIVIPSELGGKIPWICCGVPSPTTANTTFLSDDNHTKLKYVTFGDGVISRQIGQTSGCNTNDMFSGQTELIGVSNMNPEITSLAHTFNGCTNLKFIDNIGNLVNVTNLEMAFTNSGIEYLPDLSKMTVVTNMNQCFKNCTFLKRVYGMTKPSATCNTNQLFNGCTALEKAEIPENGTTMFYAFNNCTSLRTVDVKATGITAVDHAFYGCTDLTVYVVADSTTYDSIFNAYGSSTNVTILTGNGETLPVIAVWGDSTSSPNRAWKEWPARLQEVVTTYAVKNQAVSGEFTTSTSARQGGNALSVGAFTIPADTSLVEITLTSADGQTFGTSPVFSAGGGFNPCTIAGVQGTIVNAGSGVYKFARKTDGDSVEVPDGSIVTSDADGIFNNADAVMLVNIGINAGWNTDSSVLLNQVQMMVDHFTESGGTKYIITGPYAGQFLNADSQRAVVFDYETKAETAFGEHWLNLREYLIANGLTENGLTASALDTERMAVGQIPASLLGGGSTTEILIFDGETVTDQTHPNTYGQNSIFNAFYAKGQALGYWG